VKPVAEAAGYLPAKAFLVVDGVALRANNPEDGFAGMALQDLSLHDMLRVLEQVVHAAHSRAIAEDEVVLVPPIDRGDESAGPTAFAGSRIRWQLDNVSRFVSHKWHDLVVERCPYDAMPARATIGQELNYGVILVHMQTTKWTLADACDTLRHPIVLARRDAEHLADRSALAFQNVLGSQGDPFDFRGSRQACFDAASGK
jgi:hypothetical protein